MGEWLNCQHFGAVPTCCAGQLCTCALPSALLVQPGQSSLLPGSDHTKVLWGCWLLCWKTACLHVLLSRKPFILLAPATACAGSLGPCLQGQVLPGSLVSERGLSGGAEIHSEPESRCCLPSCGKGSVQHIMCSLVPYKEGAAFHTTLKWTESV